MQEANESSIIENLKSSKGELQQHLIYAKHKHERTKRNAIICIIFGIFFLLVVLYNPTIIKFLDLKADNSIVSFIIDNTPFMRYIYLTLSIFLIFIGMINLAFTPNKSISILAIEDNIAQIDEELELLDISEKQYEKRAEIQFKNSQKSLKRYYDINLNQLKVVFPVGIVTMAIGVSIIIISILIFKDTAYNDIMPTLIGSISGILIDFIGAIFIKMYIETVKASTEFHNKLIHSNDNIFANVLITRISDEKLRNETLAEIAKIIAHDTTNI